MIFLFLHYTRTKEPRTWQNGDGVVGRERRCPFLVGFSSQIAAGLFPFYRANEGKPKKKTKDHHRSTPRNEELAKWFLNGENQSARSRVSLSDLKHSRYWRFLLLSLNSFVSVSLALPFYSLSFSWRWKMLSFLDWMFRAPIFFFIRRRVPSFFFLSLGRDETPSHTHKQLVKMMLWNCWIFFLWLVGFIKTKIPLVLFILAKKKTIHKPDKTSSNHRSTESSWPSLRPVYPQHLFFPHSYRRPYYPEIRVLCPRYHSESFTHALYICFFFCVMSDCFVTLLFPWWGLKRKKF